MSLKKYGPHYSCSSNGMPHTNLLNVKGHFKSLSRINTVQIPIVLSIGTPTQMKPSFISEECKFWVKNTEMYCRKHQLRKYVLLSYNHLHLLQPVLYGLSTVFCLVYFLYKKDQLERTFFTSLKIVDEAGTRTSG
jgi:hypothetical protein